MLENPKNSVRNYVKTAVFHRIWVKKGLNGEKKMQVAELMGYSP